MIALRHCSAFLGRIVAVWILALPTPSVLAHLLDAALGLPAKFLERQRRICPALASSVTEIASHPHKLIPIIFVVVTVLAFNFLGDGLRDAADPYK